LARYRLSDPAKADIAGVLRISQTQHGAESRETAVAEPVHVIFFRALEPGFVEIVRFLHERMEPSRHVGEVKGGER
jgi:hypothetical protein